MSSPMMIIQYSATRNLYVCPSSRHLTHKPRQGEDPTIPIYHSEMEAYREGWWRTDDTRWTPPDGHGWICPECANIVIHGEPATESLAGQAGALREAFRGLGRAMAAAWRFNRAAATVDKWIQKRRRNRD